MFPSTWENENYRNMPNPMPNTRANTRPNAAPFEYMLPALEDITWAQPAISYDNDELVINIPRLIVSAEFFLTKQRIEHRITSGVEPTPPRRVRSGSVTQVNQNRWTEADEEKKKEFHDTVDTMVDRFLHYHRIQSPYDRYLKGSLTKKEYDKYREDYGYHLYTPLYKGGGRKRNNTRRVTRKRRGRK
jgi:hypothetical protein